MTANGDLLRQLFKGHTKRDDSLFKTAAEAIIHGERLKNHRVLAEDLERILLNGNGAIAERRNLGGSYELPKDRERGFPLLDISEFHYDWNRLVLDPKTSESLVQITREYHHQDLLAAGGLRPTQRVLFYGPPGCGKTLAARVMASVLGYPLITIRFDAVVSSYLGETASNLRRVFDFIQRGQWVVLFDEFDAIGKDRDNPFEHGELKRVVNSLLQLIDAFRGESLLIAATNHENLLDTAIWRRFEQIVEFKMPSEQDRLLLLRLFLGGFDTSNLDFGKLAHQTQKASGSDIERLATEAARKALMDGRKSILKEDIESPLNFLQKRLSVIKNLSIKSNHPSESPKKKDSPRKARQQKNGERSRTSPTT